MKRIWLFLLGVIVICMLSVAGCTSSQQNTELPTQTPVVTTQVTSVPVIAPTTAPNSKSDLLQIGAFNVQIFGVSKAAKPEVMEVIADVIRDYDIIAIQEIRDSSETALVELVDLVNTQESSQYEFIVSERLGRTSSKEQYAYIYNTRSVELISDPYTYPEPTGTDPFHREPYIASFKAINGDFDATFVTIHTDPDEATEEINSLDEVVNYAISHTPYDKDVIVMGDFNADGSYFDEDGYSSLKSSDYTWIIDNNLDTTTKSTDYTYDRIVLTQSVLPYYTSSSGVIRYDLIYGLTQELTEEVSDHYPVYAQFNTVSGNAEYSVGAVTVSATPTPKATSTFVSTPTNTLIITPVPTPIAASNSGVYISGLSLANEWVKITNDGESVNLQGWYIQDNDAKHTYTFPSFTLKTGYSVTLYSKEGSDTSTELFWDTGNVWNNDGDTARLYDGNGKLVSQK